MRFTTVTTSLLCAALALGGACRGSNNGDDDTSTDGGNGDGSNPNDTTIYDIQQGVVSVGTAVTIRGVVVTAVDEYGGRVGGVYVEEPAGGAYSGVFVFNPTGADSVAVGDLVDITGGAVDEFALNTDTSGRKLTEISPPDMGTITIAKVGTGTVPDPEVVDPVALAADENEAEKWEGVLVKFENVAVTEAPGGVSSTDATLKSMHVTGPFEVSSALTLLGTGGTELTLGTCLTSITGVGDYFFDYKINPRSDADFGAVGTACPTENTMAQCTNTTDDDHDGFIDCLDFSCQSVVGLDCSTDTTIAMIQTGTVPNGSLVGLSQVVVTGVAKFKTVGVTTPVAETRVWVSDSATAAPNTGILIFKPDIAGATVDTLAVGDLVDVTNGKVSEFNGETEIQGQSAAVHVVVTKTGTGAAPTPAAVTPAMMSDAATAETYEGVLVQISNQKVVSANPDAATMTCGAQMNQSCDFGEWTVGTVANAVRVDDIMVKRPTGLAVDTCYAKIVGPVSFGFSTYKVEPRTDGDLATGGTCN